MSTPSLARKIARTASGLTIACIIGLTVWNFTPSPSGPFPPDPAVAYANKASGGQGTYREHYFEYNDQTLHYVEVGEGPLVVLVHGFPAYWYAMVRQMEALKANYRVVAIDALGAGRSDAPRDQSAYTLRATSAHLYALLQSISPTEKVHLIGHDWGGAFVFAFAEKYADKVHTVTSISAPPYAVFLKLLETNETQKRISSYVEKLQSANPVLLALLRAPGKIWSGAYAPLLEAGKISPEESELFRNNFRSPRRISAYLNWYRANVPPFDEITREDYWPSNAPSLDVPVLLIRGKDDPVFVPEYVLQAQARYADTLVLELDGVGHWPQMETPERTNRAIVELLSRIED